MSKPEALDAKTFQLNIPDKLQSPRRPTMTVPMAATINIFVDYAVTKYRATEGGSGKHLTRNHFIKAFNVKQASPPESGLEISVTNIILCFTIPDFQVTTKINKDSDGFLKKSFYVHPSHQYKMEVNKDVIT